MPGPVRWRRLAAFFVATVATTQLVARMADAMRGGGGGGGGDDVARWAARANLLMLVPGTVAVAFATVTPGAPARLRLGLAWRPTRWWLVAWLLPGAIAAAMIGAVLLVPGTRLTPPRTGPWAILPLKQPWAALLAGLLAGGTVCLPGALGEELAWRGFLRHELQPLGFWPSSLVIAFAWWGWHLPPYVQADKGLPLALTIFLTTPLILYIRNRSGSVLATALFHGTMSGTWLIPGFMVAGGGPWVPLAMRVPGLLCLALTALAVRRQPLRATV